MSWDGDQGGSDPLPVDSLVKGIRNVLEDFQDICKDFRGQEKHCCDTVRSCYSNIDSTLTSVRLQGAIKQDIHRACRRIDDQLHAINICVENKLRACNKVDTRDLEAEYEEFKLKFKTEFDNHCTNLPPERTTVKTTPRTTTTPFITTTTKARKTTTESTTSTRYIRMTTVPSSTSTVTTTTEESKVTTEPPDQETTTISTTSDSLQKTSETAPKTSSVSHSTTEKTFIITDTDTNPATDRVSTKSEKDETTGDSNAITRTNPTNTEPKPPPTQSRDLTFTTSSHSSTGSLLSGTTAGLQHPPSDNTVIIVSAVCSGVILLIALVVFLVIRYKKKRHGEDSGDCHCQNLFTCKLFQRNKGQSNEQDGEIYTEIDEAFMQAVYEFDKKKDPHPNLKNRVQTNAHVNVCYSAGMHDDGVISSKTSHGPTLQLSTRNLRQVSKQNEYQTSKELKANLDKNKQTGYVLSHPTFTDPRGTDVVSDEYVQISEKYESIETVYDQPTHHKSDFPKINEIDDSDRNEYDHIVAQEAEVEVEEDDEPDYVNSPVSQSNDHLYENELSSYEITQSRF